jgi:hypothetical protein
MTQQREQWKRVLEAEVERWNAKPCKQLLAELGEEQVYEVKFEGKNVPG